MKMKSEHQEIQAAGKSEQPKQRTPSETFRNGQWRRWQEAALMAILLIPLSTAVVLVALFPDLPIVVKAGVIAGLIVLVVPAARVYRASLKHREGIAREITIRDLNSGAYYETLGQTQLDSGLVLAYIRMAGIKEAVLVRVRTTDKKIPDYSIATSRGWCDFYAIDKSEFDRVDNRELAKLGDPSAQDYMRRLQTARPDYADVAAAVKAYATSDT